MRDVILGPQRSTAASTRSTPPTQTRLELPASPPRASLVVAFAAQTHQDQLRAAAPSLQQWPTKPPPLSWTSTCRPEMDDGCPQAPLSLAPWASKRRRDDMPRAPSAPSLSLLTAMPPFQRHGVLQIRFVCSSPIPRPSCDLSPFAQLTRHPHLPRFRRQRLSLLRLPHRDRDQGPRRRKQWLGLRPPRRCEQAVVPHWRRGPNRPPFHEARDRGPRFLHRRRGHLGRLWAR